MLSYFESTLVSEILDECLCQIKIINQLSSEEKDIDEELHLLDEKEDENIIYVAEHTTPKQKLRKDTNTVRELFENCLQEMKSKKTYLVIKDFVKNYEDERENLQSIIYAGQQQETMITELTNQIAEAKQRAQAVADEMEGYVNKMNFQMQETKKRTEMEKVYVGKTIENEVQQTKKVCFTKQKKIQSEIEDLKHRLAQETESDDLLTNYWRIYEKELLDTLNFWKAKLFDDHKVVHTNLSILKKYKKLNMTKFKTVSKALQEDLEYLENDRSEKRRRRELKELLEKQFDCAVKIQAWWRGNLVRHHLGPFAPKKKEKKKKGGKKKKKK